MQLHEQYRPRDWSEVVGQEKALKIVNGLRNRGLGGRAVWISGQSGTGKTTIARLIAAEIGSEWSTEELDAADCTPAKLKDVERRQATRPLGGKCWVFIINEAHGMSKAAIRQLLVMLERLPAHVCWIFTTTVEGQDRLFEDCDDSSPLISRCNVIALARRDLAKPFAERARTIAQAEGLDGQPVEKYVRLLQTHRNNLRAALQEIENGVMVG